MNAKPKNAPRRYFLTACILFLFGMSAYYYWSDVFAVRERMIAYKKATGR